MRTIVRYLINFCWFWFKWGLAACVVGAALAVPYLYSQIDDRIRAHIEDHLARQYPHLRFKVRSAILVKGEGIAVRDLSVLDPAAEGPGAELLSFDECFLSCRTDLQELLQGDVKITQIKIRRPTLRVTRRPDGSWSAARLLPLPQGNGRGAADVIIENGTIEIFDPLKTPSSTLTLRELNVTISPLADPPTAVSGISGNRNPKRQRGQEAAEAAVHSVNAGGSTASGLADASGCDVSGSPPKPGTASGHRRRLQGTLSGDHFRQLVFKGQLDPHRPEFSISGTVEGLEVSPELRSSIPGCFSHKLTILENLRGQAELSFQVHYDPAAPTPLRFDVVSRLVRGRIDDSRLPHPLTEIRALGRLTNDGFTISDFAARSNQASLVMNCRGAGLDPSSPVSLEAEVRNLDLDHQLLDVLPDNLKEQWYKYRPEGQIDAYVTLAFDGDKWHPQLELRSSNISFTNHKFPYRLDRGRGHLRLKDNVLNLGVIAFSENQMVRIDGQLNSPLRGSWGWIEAKGEDLPLDKKLLLALPEKTQAVIRSLDLRGTIGFEYRMWRDSADGPTHNRLSARARQCAIRYEKFPYSLSNIRANVEMHDGNWWFRDMEGNNGACVVTGEGSIAPTPSGGQLLLSLRATTVSLEDELRDALQPSMRQVWSMLKPRGIIDLVTDLRYVEGSGRLDVAVRAEPRSEICSIEPVAFPYRMEKLQGVLTYRDGRVTLDRFRGEHGPVKMASAGYCSFGPDGSWRLHLDGLSIDRLRVDRELLQAVPARLKKPLCELNPTGPIHIRGSFDLARDGGLNEPVRSGWDVTLGLQQLGIDCGVRLENINGSMTLAGSFDGQNFQSEGRLALDSLNYKDFQFTEVQGSLWMDDQQVLLGSWVDRRYNSLAANSGSPPRQPRPLEAKLFGGNFYGDAWVALGQRPRYGLQATLIDADLSRCAREVISGQQNLRGRVNGTVELRGDGRTTNTLAGHGNLHLRDANVYELPVMIAMLKLLSARAPDANAFSRSDIEFRIQGEHFYFDKLDFTGDMFRLVGKGEMDFKLETQMTLSAAVGRGELNLPVVRNLFTGASQQIMQIHVSGPLSNPVMSKEAFPGVNQAIQQLQARQGGEQR